MFRVKGLFKSSLPFIIIFPLLNSCSHSYRKVSSLPVQNDINCSTQLNSVLRSQAERFNHLLSKNYPDLSLILNDVQAFKRLINSRFEKQKKISPSDPYQFDYSELGMPVISFMKSTLLKNLKKKNL